MNNTINNLPLCAVRGGGDLATGTIARLYRVGFPVIVLELPQPRTVRRRVSMAEAIFSGEIVVEGVHGVQVSTPDEARACLKAGDIPVVVDPDGDILQQLPVQIIVDARMFKRELPALPTGNAPPAPLVIGLGPGFVAGHSCHAVVETNRGHHLGRVYWQGNAQPDTGIPGTVRGYDVDRVLRAPRTGIIHTHAQIGDILQPGDLIAEVAGISLAAPFAGTLRGLLHDGLAVSDSEKIGDLDPRNRAEHVTTISDKALAIAGGVLEAVFVGLRQRNGVN